MALFCNVPDISSLSCLLGQPRTEYVWRLVEPAEGIPRNAEARFEYTNALIISKDSAAMQAVNSSHLN